MSGSFEKLFVCPVPSEFHEHLNSIVIPKKFEEDHMLFTDGEKADHLYWIHSGKVKIGKTTSEGKELILYVCQENEIIGELALFQPQDMVYTTTAQMMESGLVSAIPRRALEELLISDGKIAVEFMKWMGTAFRRNQSKFRDLLLYGKQGALYSTLVRMSNSYGKKVEDGILIDLPLTNQELANFIASTREQVNRTLNELRKSNVISMANGYITIHDVLSLKRYLDCDDCPEDICRI